MKERHFRGLAIAALVLMTLIFIALSGLSFTPARGAPNAAQVTFRGQNAAYGKNVFNAYDGMDCHTIVGNGGYFAPDLTDEYKEVGPAFLLAFLPSANQWPTKILVDLQIQQLIAAHAIPEKSIAQYYQDYPGALSRVEGRGGVQTDMPTLPFTAQQINGLVAFLKYSSSLDTEGWPPTVEANPSTVQNTEQKLVQESGLEGGSATPPITVPTPPATSNGSGSQAPSTGGKSSTGGGKTTAPTSNAAAEIPAGLLIYKSDCSACHAASGPTKVGPTFQGLYGSTVQLANGKTVTANAAYIRDHILQPQNYTVKGFNKGVMPSFKGMLSDQQIQDVTAWIRSLR